MCEPANEPYVVLCSRYKKEARNDFLFFLVGRDHTPPFPFEEEGVARSTQKRFLTRRTAAWRDYIPGDFSAAIDEDDNEVK